MSNEVYMGVIGEPVTLGVENLSQSEQQAVASGAGALYRPSPSGTKRFVIDAPDRDECERRFPGFASFKDARAAMEAHA